MDTEQFGSHLISCGFNFWSGVPCSYLAPLINWSMKNTLYIAAVNEGDAVASCAGAYLGGARSVVLMQNSGLTNALSPLTSLTLLYQMPVLGFVSLRADEPQHELMGSITEKLLELVKIPWLYLSDNFEEAIRQVEKAEKVLKCGQSFFFIVKKNVFNPFPELEIRNTIIHKTRVSGKRHKDQRPLRNEVLQALCKSKDSETIFMSTTGYTSRELYTIEDTESNFYMLGSLGCISSCALGLSLVQPMKVVTIDGDGSLLMRLGSLAANASYAPSNMLHILLDNGVHESTGCQPTVSPSTDFVHIAADCGYKRVIYAHNIDEMIENYHHWVESPALTFIHIKTSAGTSKSLPRPSIKPYEIANRCRSFILKNRSIS